MKVPPIVSEPPSCNCGARPQDPIHRKWCALASVEIPPTDKITRRPVYDRMLRRKHHMPLEPPTEQERSDAIRILRSPWEDDLSVEALRILDECGT